MRDVVDRQEAGGRGHASAGRLMALSSIVAIYFLFFAFSAFLLLPFGVRTDEEVGTPKIAGQADSAPHRFDLKRHLLRAALVGALLFALYYANWTYGWITPDDLDIYHRL
jgi:predicted secreted protein